MGIKTLTVRKGLKTAEKLKGPKRIIRPKGPEALNRLENLTKERKGTKESLKGKEGKGNGDRGVDGAKLKNI